MRKTPVILTLLICASCSPYTYQSEVSDFAQATKQTIATFNTLSDQLVDAKWREARVAFANDQIGQNSQVIGISSACGDAFFQIEDDAILDPQTIKSIRDKEAINCEVGALDLDSDKVDVAVLESIERDRVAAGRLGKFPALLDAVDDYATTLQLIVQADDRRELEGAIKRNHDGLVGLACRIDTQKGCDGTIPGTTSMIAEAFGTLLTAAMDHYRFRALRQAVAHAQQPVKQAGQILDEGQSLLMPRLLNAKIEQLTETKQSLRFETQDHANWLKLYDRMITERDDYLSSLNGIGAFHRMTLAHSALHQALQDPGTDLKALHRQINEFTEEARAIYVLF